MPETEVKATEEAPTLESELEALGRLEAALTGTGMGPPPEEFEVLRAGLRDKYGAN